MKTQRIYLFAAILTLALIFAGCESGGKDPYVEQLVLQGNMVVGHPLKVRVTHTIPIEQYYDSSVVGVPGASVKITADGREFTLREETTNPVGNGFYSLPVDSHIVAPDIHYAIRVEALGHVVTAETRSVGTVHIASQNEDTVTYGATPLVIHWDHDSLADGHWIIIESFYPKWRDPVDNDLVSGNSGASMMDGNFSYWNAVYRDDSVEVPWIILCFPGLHRVTIQACDQALWDFSSTYQPGQTDVAPVTNVHGGLGIFTVGGSDTTYFYLQKNPDIEHRGHGL
jgi:hypothetical protein